MSNKNRKVKKYESITLSNKECQDKMGLLGSCRGILGLRKSLNWVFIVDFIFLVLGVGYFIYSRDFLLMAGVIGIFLVVLVFLMAGSRIRRD